MDIRRFEKKDYDTLKNWWAAHGHPEIPFDSLSPFGVMVYDNQTPICVSFLYLMSGCRMGQIAWTTTNPQAGLKVKYNAVNACIKTLCDTARQNKRNNVICFSGSKGLTKTIKKYGFAVGKSHDLLAGILGE